MKRKIALLATLTLLFFICSCTTMSDPQSNNQNIISSTSDQNAIQLRVWTGYEDQIVTSKIINEFKIANSEVEYEITVEAIEDDSARAAIQEDPLATDVFTFLGDHINSLVKGNNLIEMKNEDKDELIANNSAVSIESSTVNDKLYGIPVTADNGYFLYYDIDYFKTAADLEILTDWDRLLDFAESKGKSVYFEPNGFYLPSFFFGTGGTIGIEGFGTIDENMTCDFNNANGLLAGEAALRILSHPSILGGDDYVFTSKFGNDAIAGVSGTWNYNTLKRNIGDARIGATILPKFTVNGTPYQSGSFNGFKYIGINANTSNPAEAIKLAMFLGSEYAQEMRFMERGYGPTNKVVSALDIVKANKVLNALEKQNIYSTSMRDVNGTFWTSLEALGIIFMNGDLGSKTMQQHLDDTVKQITEK